MSYKREEFYNIKDEHIKKIDVHLKKIKELKDGIDKRENGDRLL